MKHPDLVEDWFKVGTANVIGGSHGAGKTAFEVWMEKRILSRESFLGHATHVPPFWGVIIIDRDSSDRRAWWERAGMEPLPYYCLTEDPKFNSRKLDNMKPGEFFEFITEKVDAWKAPPGSAVTLDVMTPFSGNTKDSYMSGFNRGAQISRYALERQYTLVGNMHGGKQIQGNQYLRAIDRTIANAGFLGSVGTVSYLTTKEESNLQGQQEFYVSPHQAKSERIVLDRTENGLYTVAQEETLDTDLKVLHLMPLGADVQRAQIMAKADAENVPDALRIPERTVDRALTRLQKQGFIVNVGRGLWRRVGGN